jgi:hypothetical protein
MRYTKDFKKFSVDFHNQWQELFNIREYNWVNGDLIKLSFEIEQVHGVAEIEIYFLLFGIRIYWVHNKEQMEEKMGEYQKMLNNPDDWVEYK